MARPGCLPAALFALARCSRRPASGQGPHSPPQRDCKAQAIDYRATGQPARPGGHLGAACRSRRRRHGDQPVSIPGPAPGLAARARGPAAGRCPATGGSASGATPTPAPSGSSSPGSQASFRQCLQRQGVRLPQGRPSAGSGQPHARPTGSAASAFRKAAAACGGGTFPRGGNATGLSRVDGTSDDTFEKRN